MNKKTLDKTSDEFETPAPIFTMLHRRYEFTVDAAASDENAKLLKYWTKRHNGLEQSWAGHRVFCNPPYSRGNVKAFAMKAFLETGSSGLCRMACLLIPTYTEREWFHTMKNSGRVDIHFFKGRIQFGGGATGARGNHMIMVFWPETTIL